MCIPVVSTRMEQFVCGYCNKQFSSTSNLNKHQKRRSCKQLKVLVNQGNNTEDAKHSTHNLCKYISKLEMEIKELKEHVVKIVNNQSILPGQANECTVSTVHHNAMNVHINQTVNYINNYGKEDTRHITHDMLNKLVALKGDGVVELVRLKHCSMSVPQNRNIRIQSTKRRDLAIFKDNRWMFKDRDELLYELTMENTQKLDYHFGDNEDYFQSIKSEAEYKSIDDFFAKLRVCDQPTLKTIVKKVFNTLMSETSIGAPNRPPDIAVSPPQPKPIPFKFSPDMSPSSHPLGITGYKADLIKYKNEQEQMHQCIGTDDVYKLS